MEDQNVSPSDYDMQLMVEVKRNLAFTGEMPKPLASRQGCLPGARLPPEHLHCQSLAPLKPMFDRDDDRLFSVCGTKPAYWNADAHAAAERRAVVCSIKPAYVELYWGQCEDAVRRHAPFRGHTDWFLHDEDFKP